MHTVSNDVLQITVSEMGAELQSIHHKNTGLEYMWKGDPAFWGKKSPVLFPIVGGLKNNQYRFEGNTYPLSRHGFARERNFTVTAQTNNSIRLTLVSDKESLAVYPFHFSFSLIYTLENNRLTVTYLVENTGNTPMYFSVGAHPAFAVPLTEGTVYTDYQLVFSHSETAGKWPLSAEGLIETAPVSLLENQNTIALSKELFYGDALVFKHLQSTSLSIVNSKNSHGLTVAYSDFPFMGIWSARDADFVCIEPWCGIADSVNTSGELTAKEGINKLDAGTSFSRSWCVEVF